MVVSSLLAASAPSNAPLGFSTAPSPATNRVPPIAPYCGPAVSFSVVRVAPSPATRDVSLAVGSPLNPCPPSSGAALALPAALVAAQPAPTVVLPRAVLNALADAAGGAPFDVQVVQWGVSPNPEAAVAATRYPSLPAVSEGVVNTSLSSGRRGLGSWGFSVVASLGQTAGQASLDALTAASPRAVTDEDLLPHRPMDSRTVSVSVKPVGAARSLAGLMTPAPFTLVIPLRDLSIVAPGPSGGPPINLGQAAFASRAFNITCPLSLSAARAGVVAFELSPLALRAPACPLRSSRRSKWASRMWWHSWWTPRAPPAAMTALSLVAARALL